SVWRTFLCCLPAISLFLSLSFSSLSLSLHLSLSPSLSLSLSLSLSPASLLKDTPHFSCLSHLLFSGSLRGFTSSSSLPLSHYLSLSHTHTHTHTHSCK